jgi:pimeloyl-ACP methyl ester carboxylesterase
MMRSRGLIGRLRRLEVTVNGHTLCYTERGKGSSLLLLHGGGDSGEHSFARQLDALGKDRRIVAPDQVGQGRTPEVPGPLSYGAMMQDTAALLERLGLESVDVVGYSDGGILALMLAARHPRLVRRLVVSGANIAPAGLATQHLAALRAEQKADPTSTAEKLAKLWFTSPLESELDTAALATIRQPVLVVSGDRDIVTLEHTLEIYRALPNAQLCVLPGTGHDTFAKRPEWLNPIIQRFFRGDEGPLQA